jgi:hypothetical protein
VQIGVETSTGQETPGGDELGPEKLGAGRFMADRCSCGGRSGQGAWQRPALAGDDRGERRRRGRGTGEETAWGRNEGEEAVGVRVWGVHEAGLQCFAGMDSAWLSAVFCMRPAVLS